MLTTAQIGLLLEMLAQEVVIEPSPAFPFTVTRKAFGYSKPQHPSYTPRNAIEIICGECGLDEGARRDRKGFWRCVKCGYPSP